MGLQGDEDLARVCSYDLEAGGRKVDILVADDGAVRAGVFQHLVDEVAFGLGEGSDSAGAAADKAVRSGEFGVRSKDCGVRIWEMRCGLFAQGRVTRGERAKS
jgi:hypothetical protein